MMLAPPGDILLAQEPPEQCVVLAEVVVLMLEPTAEHREVLVLVALADHDLQASTGELVDGGVVLGDAHRSSRLSTVTPVDSRIRSVAAAIAPSSTVGDDDKNSPA